MASRSPKDAPSGAASLSGLDREIHEPARLTVMTILNTVDQADFLFLLRESGLTKGNLSIHLQRLEKAEYLTIEKTYQGKIPRTVCRITDKGRQAYRSYRSMLRNALKE